MILTAVCVFSCQILRLVTTFVEKTGEPEASPTYLAQDLLPPLLDPILGDYRANIPEARDPEVLTLFATACEKLQVGGG
jgi:exportin-1